MTPDQRDNTYITWCTLIVSMGCFGKCLRSIRFMLVGLSAISETFRIHSTYAYALPSSLDIWIRLTSPRMFIDRCSSVKNFRTHRRASYRLISALNLFSAITLRSTFDILLHVCSRWTELWSALDKIWGYAFWEETVVCWNLMESLFWIKTTSVTERFCVCFILMGSAIRFVSICSVYSIFADEIFF